MWTNSAIAILIRGSQKAISATDGNVSITVSPDWGGGRRRHFPYDFTPPIFSPLSTRLPLSASPVCSPQPPPAPPFLLCSPPTRSTTFLLLSHPLLSYSYFFILPLPALFPLPYSHYPLALLYHLPLAPHHPSPSPLLLILPMLLTPKSPPLFPPSHFPLTPPPYTSIRPPLFLFHPPLHASPSSSHPLPPNQLPISILF